jgi:hypothetical protein
MSAKTKLRFEAVTAVPSLRVAELQLASGRTARALSVGRNHVHFALDGGDEVTFTGPGVAALSIDWGGVMGSAISAANQILGSDPKKAKCTSQVDITVDLKGKITTVNIAMSCTSG